jgi:hypothetical protein
VFQPGAALHRARKGQRADLLAAIDKHLLSWQSSPASIYYQTLQRWGAAATLIPTRFWWGLGISPAADCRLGGALLLRRQNRDKTSIC